MSKEIWDIKDRAPVILPETRSDMTEREYRAAILAMGWAERNRYLRFTQTADRILGYMMKSGMYK